MNTIRRQRVWHVSDREVQTLMQRVGDSSRTLPIVVVSPAGDTHQPRVPIDLLRGRFDGLIAVLEDMAAARAFSDAGGEVLRTVGGAVRVIPPGGSRGSRLYRTYLDDDPKSTADQVCERALAMHLEVESPVVVSVTPAVLASRRVKGVGAVAEVRRAAGEEFSSALEDPVAADASVEALERAEAAERKVAELELRAAASAQRVKQERLLRREAERMAQRAPSWPPAVVHDDPQKQLEWEINHLWLLTVPEGERQSFPLREFRFGPQFMASLDAEVIDRRKALEVVVDVLTRRVWERRVCHQVRTHERGGRPVTRGKDTAWRAYIRSHTPGAARLLYFECADGSVELLAAAHHDDWSSLAGLVS